MALLTRFISIWRRRRLSPIICAGTSWSISYTRSNPSVPALPANISSTSSIQLRKSKSRSSSSILPDSILEKSRISLITVSKASPQVLMVLAYSCCSLVSCVSFKSEAMPITPFIGVRISWLIVAKNTLFALLAASACSLALRSSCADCSNCWVCCCTLYSSVLFCALIIFTRNL